MERARLGTCGRDKQEGSDESIFELETPEEEGTPSNDDLDVLQSFHQDRISTCIYKNSTQEMNHNETESNETERGEEKQHLLLINARLKSREKYEMVEMK